MGTEYRFANAKEARRGVDLLTRQAAYDSQTGIRVNRPAHPSNMSEEEIVFLHEHNYGSDISGEIAAGITASLGPRLDENSSRATAGSARGSTTATERVRLEWPNGHGAPPEVIVSEQIADSAAGRAGLSFGGNGVSTLRSAGGTRTSRLERRYTLPMGTTEGDLLRDPGLVGRSGDPRESLVISDTMNEDLAGNGSGSTHTRTYSADGALFEDGDTHWSRLANDREALESRLADDTMLHETQRDFDREGINVAPSARVGPFTLAGRFHDQTTRQHVPSLDRTESLSERRARRPSR